MPIKESLEQEEVKEASDMNNDSETAKEFVDEENNFVNDVVVERVKDLVGEDNGLVDGKSLVSNWYQNGFSEGTNVGEEVTENTESIIVTNSKSIESTENGLAKFSMHGDNNMKGHMEANSHVFDPNGKRVSSSGGKMGGDLESVAINSGYVMRMNRGILGVAWKPMVKMRVNGSIMCRNYHVCAITNEGEESINSQEKKIDNDVEEIKKRSCLVNLNFGNHYMNLSFHQNRKSDWVVMGINDLVGGASGSEGNLGSRINSIFLADKYGRNNLEAEDNRGISSGTCKFATSNLNCIDQLYQTGRLKDFCKVTILCVHGANQSGSWSYVSIRNESDIDFSEYLLRCQLQNHRNDVCGICVCKNYGIATSSRDRRIRFWSLEQSNITVFPYSKILLEHTSFVGSLAWVSPNEQFPKGGLISGETYIVVLV